MRMKIVTTKVKVERNSSCIVPSNFATEEQLEKQKEKIVDMILDELRIAEYCDAYKIQVEHDIEEAGGSNEKEIKK